jgi:hypothetical protein
LIGKRQRIAPARQPGGQTLGVFVGLRFNAGEGDAFFLGFDYASGFAVDVEKVIGKTVAGQREFADSHAL